MVKHLPPAIKQLLTLRNPHPLPSPSANKLDAVLRRTHESARARNAETGWLVLSTCTLLTANRPSTIGQLYRFATGLNPLGSNDVKSSANKAALMRESALKSTIFVGVPRVILSLTALNESLEDEVKGLLRKESRRLVTPANVEATVERGAQLWKSIYAPHDVKLYDKLGSYHPDFISFIIQAYGSVLAPLPAETKSFADVSEVGDQDQGNLSRAQGSIVGIACLRTEERVVPQLTSHVFGLLKARYETPVQRHQSEEDKWLSSDEGAEWVLRSVDEILDVVRAEDEVAETGDVKARL